MSKFDFAYSVNIRNFACCFTHIKICSRSKFLVVFVGCDILMIWGVGSGDFMCTVALVGGRTCRGWPATMSHREGSFPVVISSGWAVALDSDVRFLVRCPIPFYHCVTAICMFYPKNFIVNMQIPVIYSVHSSLY